MVDVTIGFAEETQIEVRMKFRKELVGSTTTTLILSVLGSSPAHGYEIVRRVNALSNGILEWQEGTIYPALHKLEAKDLIRGRWVDSRKGRSRRIYALTAIGKDTLGAEAREWSAYSHAVANVLRESYA
jgi:PadR family transcriptional regulator, regulatory protein PadR